MAPLFSKVDLNKLWHVLQNEETLICAKFGKDLFNISEVIGRKKVAQFFFDSRCIYYTEFASFVARMKKYLLLKVYAFRFRRRRFFHKRTNKTATLNVSILYIVGLGPISFPCNSYCRMQ